jgi:hypothetical protein
MFIWGPEDNNLRSRVVVCRSLLRATTRIPRDSHDPLFNLPPTDRWSNRASQPDLRRHAESLCHRVPRKLGQEAALGRVLVQQQLPGESKIAPFEVLYGRRCRTSLNWIEPREKVSFGPNNVEEAEMIVRRIQGNLKAVKSCQETYANKKH